MLVSQRLGAAGYHRSTTGRINAPLVQRHARCGARRACARPARSRTLLAVRANYDNFSRELLGPNFHNRARISDEMFGQIMQLPGTTGMSELRARADALTTWKLRMQRGTLPAADEVAWPQEPFKSKFMAALNELEMARFTRRYPAVLDMLLKQMLQLVHGFETKLAEAEANKQRQQQQRQQPQAAPPQSSSRSDPQGDESPADGEDGDAGDSEPQELSQQEMRDLLQEAKQAAQGGNGKRMEIQLEAMEGQAGKKESQEQTDEEAAMAKAMEEAAEQLVSEWQKDAAEAVANLERAQLTFDDLEGLLEGQEGFDLAQGVWQKAGWREMDDLRKKLENLRELRDLVRSLGRGGGKGPLRRAPEELEQPRLPPGVVRSPLQPEEVRGLTRSGDLSRMLPSEMALLAHGWPRRGGSTDGGAGRGAGSGSSSEAEEAEEYYLPGAHAARMLHRVRRAERALLSYERTGWLDDTPSKVTGRMEIRPAAEMGPIILCLDTSGSMQGAREVVAKALALECLRGAHRQQRACYLYAFSGPDQVQELELKVDSSSLSQLLDFLTGTFNGGTDVDRPLALSLERLAQAEWCQADILMVTDGEISPPSEALLEGLRRAQDELGLKVHGLLVSGHVSEAMKQLCTDLHVFKSWSVVGGESWQYR